MKENYQLVLCGLDSYLRLAAFIIHGPWQEVSNELRKEGGMRVIRR